MWEANLEMRERVDWKKNHQTKYLISNTTKIFPKFYDKGVSVHDTSQEYAKDRQGKYYQGPHSKLYGSS